MILLLKLRFSEEAIRASSDRELRCSYSQALIIRNLFLHEYENFVETVNGYRELGDKKLTKIFVKRRDRAKMILSGAEKALSQISNELQRRDLL